MSFTIVFIAIGLSMDALAISVAGGIILKQRKLYHALRMGLSFGLAQMIMPILGWSLGFKARNLIAGFDHWLAFVLLTFIGGKMIYEATKIEKIEQSGSTLANHVLLGLSIATSMDALAVGLSFAFLNIAIILPAIIIGVVTFSMCFLGFFVGSRFGHLFEQKVEVVGGLILIGIGTKILLEHFLRG
jgi:manganese efflux pump family protein